MIRLLLTSLTLLALSAAPRLRAQNAVLTPTNVTVRVLSANLPDNGQSYGDPQIRILQGLRPDVVAIQEFNHLNNSSQQIRAFVDTAFGPEFQYFRESGYSIPNGVVSRYPILAAGSWEDVDPGVNDRGFAWARLDVPGPQDLYVVSVHLKAVSGADNATRRNAQAQAIKALIAANFPANAWVVVAGDLNTQSRGEEALATFKTFLSDAPIPSDAVGDRDTNLGRDKPYDYVLPSFNFATNLVPVAMPSRSFTNGLVFDSRLYTPLTDAPGVWTSDSANCQHMAVVKDFRLTWSVTNYRPAVVMPPQAQVVAPGGTAAFSVVVTGTPPFSYQWRRDGFVVAGATQSSLTLTGVQPVAQGSYTVVVTNGFGGVTSPPAPLTLLVPPAINEAPASQTVAQGAPATFTVVASGTVPLSYQWRFGGTNLSGATASAYTRANVQPATQGEYSVVVSNAAGGVTSPSAALSLHVPSPLVELVQPALLRWSGLSNLAYRVETATNLAAPVWSNLGSALAPGTVIWFTNASLDDQCRAFRVVYP